MKTSHQGRKGTPSPTKVRFERRGARSNTSKAPAFFSNKRKEERKEIEEIDKLIEQRDLIKQKLSRSTIETYVPLTETEKVKEIQELDESSTNRFREYSNLFDKIKTQIKDINNSLNTNEREKNKRIILNFNDNDYIEEKEEENFLSPKKDIIPKIPDTQFELELKKTPEKKESITSIHVIDEEDGEEFSNEKFEFNNMIEHTRNIKVNVSPELESLKTIKNYHSNPQTKRDNIFTTSALSTEEGNTFKGAKKPLKEFYLSSGRSPKSKMFDNNEFYYEPKLFDGEEDNKTQRETIREIKYCNCNIM